MSMPTLPERLRDMWEDATFGGDLPATLIVLVALALAVGLSVLYNGFAVAVWRRWLGL